MHKSPTPDAVRVPIDAMQQFVTDVFKCAPIPDEHAELIAHLLIDTEVRGVKTHGVRQVERYVDFFVNGDVNPGPQTRIVQETSVTTAMNGDFGLGMIVANEAIGITIAKAREHGIAAATTTHHGHIGSCGKYVRQALRQGLGAFCLTGNNSIPEGWFTTEHSVQTTTRGAPGAAFGMPSSEGLPDFLLDMACYLFEGTEEIIERWPPVFFRMFGMAHVANFISASMGGQAVGNPGGGNPCYPRAHQSSFIMVVDPDRFAGRDAYFEDVDRMLSGVQQMAPIKGFDKPHLAGGPEFDCEQDCRANGVPIEPDVREILDRMAARFSIAAPWA